MIGRRGYPWRCSSRDYDCFVTFLKVSDIGAIPLRSLSFPSAESPPGGGSVLPKRFLKLTTLYGTGQQEIGIFQISGDECDVKQQRSYKFESTDSGSVTKLHIYVDEVCSSGLTGHVTIDLKEFIGENGSEIYLEYPLSASSPRHRAAKLKVVVRCRGQVEDENDECLDMDLETFLVDEFPESFSVPEVEHLLHAAGAGGETNSDDFHRQQRFLALNQAVYQAKPTDSYRRSQTERHLLKDLEGDLLGLNAKLKQFVEEFAQPRSVLGQRRRERGQKQLSKPDLRAAVFFAAGVATQQRLHSESVHIASQSISFHSEETVDHDIPPTTSSNFHALSRSKSDHFDVKRVLSSPETPLPEVVALREETLDELKLNMGPFSDCSSSSNNRDIESVQSCGNQEDSEERVANYLHSLPDFVGCPTCSTADSGLRESPFSDPHVSPARHPLTSRTSVEEKQSPTPVPSSFSKKSMVLIIRNVLGVLLIAGVSFVLGAKGGFLGATREMSTNGNSVWMCTESQQVGARKETVSSQMANVILNGMVGEFQAGSSIQNHPTLTSFTPPLLANKVNRPRQLLENHRKQIAFRWSDSDEKLSNLKLSSPEGRGTEDVLQEGKLSYHARANNYIYKDQNQGDCKSVLSRNGRGGVDILPRSVLSNQMMLGATSNLKRNVRVKPAVDEVTETLQRRYTDSEHQVELLGRKMLKGCKAGSQDLIASARK